MHFVSTFYVRISSWVLPIMKHYIYVYYIFIYKYIVIVYRDNVSTISLGCLVWCLKTKIFIFCVSVLPAWYVQPQVPGKYWDDFYGRQLSPSCKLQHSFVWATQCLQPGDQIISKTLNYHRIGSGSTGSTQVVRCNVLIHLDLSCLKINITCFHHNLSQKFIGTN